jgi:phosphinothricin acetyltransferase
MSGITIRLATAADLETINEIYNHYVINSTCTYQTEPENMDARRTWFAAHGERHPITVAEEAGQIVGWGSLSRFHARAAYSCTVENSIYVNPRQLRRGIGRMLLNDLIDRARRSGHHTIIAGIDAEQTPSVAIHAAMGFEKVALLKEVGFKFDRWLHVIYMQKMLNSPPPFQPSSESPAPPLSPVPATRDTDSPGWSPAESQSS